MHKHIIFSLLLLSIFFSGCTNKIPKPIKVDITDQKIDYINDIKPILDKRCVSCHSCYNSPCQAKFSSFEGIDRGASKLEVYNATRLSAMDPTRLFIDAQTTKQWREKEFFSLTDNFELKDNNTNNSIMMHMINEKKLHPEIIGSYKPETDDLICPKNLNEMADFINDKPYHAMPYGFPQITNREYKIIMQWLAKGAKGPNKSQQKKLTSPSKKAQIDIKKWEKFLNKQDPKHILTARYLYEHLYLAHLYFTTAPNEFFEIVRSKTPYPKEIDIIPTVRPFDDPQVKNFYYRLRKIHSTIVFKTHMVLELNDKKLQRINELFIKPKWIEKPHLMSYETKLSANPFVVYFQIPAKSRYQFLLDNSQYIITTFIRGPVCRGQMALNVIHDHFWVMFKDPKYDISIQQPGFLLLQADNLSMPIESSTQSIFKTFSDEYRDKYRRFGMAKQKLYQKTYPKGKGINSIWKGNTKDDAPILTVYRHFDSASVHKGVLGKLPRTMWVIDYPQFERIYYSLVAGYDVFGNVSHQTNIRRYMDFLRMEGEINFVTYMPKNIRLDMLRSWYIGDNTFKDDNILQYINNNINIKYKTSNPKKEFIEMLVKDYFTKNTNIKFDNINYLSNHSISLPKQYKSKDDMINAARVLSTKGIGFLKYATQEDINTLFVRVIMPDKTSQVYTLVINRWHDNVNSLFSEEDRLDSSKDTLDIIKGSVGSYPNLFLNVDYKNLPEFFDTMINFDNTPKYLNKLKEYIVFRSDKNFWETFDWFQQDFYTQEPIRSGLYDLNRYFHKSIN